MSGHVRRKDISLTMCMTSLLLIILSSYTPKKKYLKLSTGQCWIGEYIGIMPNKLIAKLLFQDNDNNYNNHSQRLLHTFIFFR